MPLKCTTVRSSFIMADIPQKVYNPKDFEKRIYEYWLENGLFKPKENENATFTIVIPPPNVTGVLHMGHGLNNVLQDIIIRYHRMDGKSVLWVPGCDHAGIATQNVVERKLRKNGISKHDLGRENFIQETWKVKKEHHGIITKQLQKIGASCDWSRERFTLDEGLSQAVRKVFVGLYERDLIYQGNYLINWCSSCGTAISDDEVEYAEEAGKLYHYQYPIVGQDEVIEIATTRPETMLGDTAVAVHPEDERYAHLVGKRAVLPLTGRTIPIVADSWVDREFGTGAVKVTPGHDPNDWEIARRHDLKIINILNPDGTLNNSVPEKYQGMSVETARKTVIEDLKNENLYLGEEEHNHQVGHCYRCNTLIEPYLSKQWFVRMKPLAEKALKAWQTGEVQFYPVKWENTYKHWLSTIRDWCISRQLWWGHRIPVWYCDNCGKVVCSMEDPDACPECGGKVHQDEDVLDTWFSSMLWPFSTLGWPEETADLKKFFPTSALVTAYDIIFFWVARMIMASMEFMGEAPFHDIYIHGLVRDKQGRKMSKSLGNGIDPLEIVDEYGADALKFTLTFLAAQGQDILIDKDTFKLGSKFANKIWNAVRYLFINMEGRKFLKPSEITLNELDKWIFHRLNETVKTVRSAVESYRFNDAAQGVYEFFWNDFCDWYIEGSKLFLSSEDEEGKDRAVTLLAGILEESLRLLHPFLSFITEEIYQKLPKTENLPLCGSVITAPYPEERKERENPETGEKFASLQELVRGVRTLRSEFTIPPSKRISLHVKTDEGFAAAGFFQEYTDLITLLLGGENITISTQVPDKEGAVQVAGNGFEAYVYVRDVIDVHGEVERLKKELGKLTAQLKKTEGKLGNEKFLKNAPEDIVEKEKSIQKELSSKIDKITAYIQNLG